MKQNMVILDRVVYIAILLQLLFCTANVYLNAQIKKVPNGLDSISRQNLAVSVMREALSWVTSSAILTDSNIHRNRPATLSDLNKIRSAGGGVICKPIAIDWPYSSAVTFYTCSNVFLSHAPEYKIAIGADSTWYLLQGFPVNDFEKLARHYYGEIHNSEDVLSISKLYLKVILSNYLFERTIVDSLNINQVKKNQNFVFLPTVVAFDESQVKFTCDTCVSILPKTRYKTIFFTIDTIGETGEYTRLVIHEINIVDDFTLSHRQIVVSGYEGSIYLEGL